MKRLTAYLARLFVADALILFGVVCFLLWLINCLRSFDVVSGKGQGLLTLGEQALLTMPPLAISFFYVCIGIGLARALQSLQANRELHIIHTSYGLPSLWSAAAIVAATGVVGVLLLSNFIEPYTNRRLNDLSASIAADLVSSTLKPGRFTQATPGVVLLIGGRTGNGEIQQFFADDRRDPEVRRTYLAQSARVSTDGENYVIELRNGTLQSSEAGGRFSEILFERYDVNVDRLSQALASPDPMYETDSVALLMQAWTNGEMTPQVRSQLISRMSEGTRVIGICMMVLALMAFPNGRRSRFSVPMEAVVLLIAFGERGVSAYSPLGPSTGGAAMILVAGVSLALQSRRRRLMPAVAQ